MFSKYHYLSHTHNNAASVYFATVNDEIAGFISVLHFVHPIVKNMKKVHRLVVLPEYQGIGVGNILLNEVAKLYINNRFSIVTSSPSLISSLKKSKEWIAKRIGRASSGSGKIQNKNIKGSTSCNRITVSFEYNNSEKTAN